MSGAKTVDWKIDILRSKDTPGEPASAMLLKN